MNDAEQLQTFGAIRDFLAARNVALKPDKQIEDRAAAVAAVARVARYLGLEDATKLMVKQFNDAPEEVRDGWTVNRVIKACDTWRAAREAAAGGKAKPTARQRALHGALGARALQTDDHIASVRRWLDTKPPKFGVREYDEWVLEENATRGEHELRLPRYASIRMALRLSWPNVLRVARGELSVKAAQQTQLARTSKAATGELLMTRDIVMITGRNDYAVRGLSRMDDFPVAVFLVEGCCYWFRSDITAYFASEPFPERELNELKDVYVDVNEAAKIAGISRHSVGRLKGSPEPKYRGAHRLWLRSDVEAWRDERRRQGVGSGRYPRKRK